MASTATDSRSLLTSVDHSALKKSRRPGPTRVAVVGAGYIAEFHLEILKGTPGVELTCVMDVAQGRAEDAARRYGAKHATTDLDDLVEWEVDVAHVLVPPNLHGPVVEGLIERGIGAFVEKPLCPSLAEAERLTQLARTAGVPLGVNHNATFHPAFQRMLEKVRAGDIGAVQHVQVTLSVPLRQLDAGQVSHWMFQEPRNIIFEQAIHPFSQLVELIGDLESMDVSVLGTQMLAGGLPFHDRWLLSAKSKGGTAEIYLAFGQPFTKSVVEVLGTDGKIAADLHHDLVDFEEKTLYLDFWNSFLAGNRRGKHLKGSARTGLKNYLLQTLGLAPRRDAFYVGMRDAIRTFHAELAEGRPFSTGAPHALATIQYGEAAVAKLAAAPPAPKLPAPGKSRNDEVVVIGGTGFIGRRTLKALFERDVNTTLTVRRRHALPDIVTEAAQKKRGRLRVVDASLTDVSGLAEAIKGAKCVLHLATGGGATWADLEKNMIGGTVKVAEACLEAGVERLVYVSSTAALYLGHDCGSHSLDDSVGPDPKLEERGMYAKGKAIAEQKLMELHRDKGLPVTIVRPAIVVGEGTPMQHSGYGLWVRDNHCVGWGLGDTPVPLVHADDVADALARLAVHEGTDLNGKALNLAARSTKTPREIIANLKAQTGRDLHFHPRSLMKSQVMEIGKWIVKKVGGRKDAQFPSFRDLKSRAMVPELSCDLARNVLGWTPEDDGDRILSRALKD